MEAAIPDHATAICNHCDRAIPLVNIDLHYAHCSRNLVRCEVCGDMVPKVLAQEHYLNIHAPVACSLCSETMERDILDIHRDENCLRRIVSCDFCEFPLPAIDLADHQEVCGNRTELCHLCNKYVRLRNRYNHEDNCNRFQDKSVAGESRYVRPVERDESAPRRPQNDFSRRCRITFTTSMIGVVILISIFLRER